MKKVIEYEMKKVIEYEPKVTQMKLEECEVCEGVGIIGADHPKNDAPHGGSIDCPYCRLH